MSQNTHEIEISMEEAQKLVDRRNQLEKLMVNREFRKIILDGYFIEEAARLVGISAEANLNENGRREVVLAIQSISILKQFFRKIRIDGEMAETEIEDHKQALEELRLEELQGAEFV